LNAPSTADFVGDTDTFNAGDKPILPGVGFWALGGVGQADGEGMISEGYLDFSFSLVATARFNECEIMSGTSTDSSSVRLYKLSLSASESRLLQREDASEV